MDFIWDDIDNEADIIPISMFNYDSKYLTNNLYDILSNRNNRRSFINKNKSSKPDIKKIIDHTNLIKTDVSINNLITHIFKKEQIDEITSIDKLFINVFYRKILRAKLESDFLNKELPKGLIITWKNIDYQIVSTLRIIRIICNFLEIKSTISEEFFSINKLDKNIFWIDISNKLINLFGENTVFLIDETSTRDNVFFLLNIVFDKWSGTMLLVDNDIIKLKPSLYVKRLINKIINI